MMLEELALDGLDSRRPESLAGAAAYPVVIIGCGMSGLLAAVRLQQAGFPFVVVEKNDGPGGTWWENRYPGARVDVGSHFYSYSFEPADHWTEFFSRQPELQAYFQRVLEEQDIAGHVRFGTEATAAAYDDATRTWTVHLEGGESLTARAVVCAVGQLNRPFVPDVPGEFDGPAFHTAALARGRRPHRQGRGDGRGRRDRVPGGAGDRRHGAVADRAAAHRAVDVPQPRLPRRGRAGRRLGDPAPAVLRALVPVPHALAGLRRRPGRGQGRPGLGAAAAVRERGQRPGPHHVHRVDHQPGRRGPGAGRQGRAALPAHREAHAPGQRLAGCGR